MNSMINKILRLSFLPNVTCHRVVDEVYLPKPPALLGSLPILVAQITLAMLANYVCFLVFHRLHQPRIVSDIIGGCLISPTLLSQINSEIPDMLWPTSSWAMSDMVANMGLAYTMFIQGLHMDMSPITRQGTKILGIAATTIALPFVISCGLYYALPKEGRVSSIVTLYWGIILGSTSFPTLAVILANLKLLSKDLGREALSFGMINDVFSWLHVFFILAILNTAAGQEIDLSKETIYAFSSSVIFVLVCYLVIRPLITRLVPEKPEGEGFNDSTIQFVLFLVPVCGFITDYIGSHFVFGAFVLGMCIPYGALSSTIVERMEDCMLGVLMPLYFAVIARKVNVSEYMQEIKSTWTILMIVFVKVLCTSVSSFIYNWQFHDGLALGILLCVKGLLPVVVINVGHNRKHLSDGSFCSMLVIIFLSTVMVEPIMDLVYKRIAKRTAPYKQRTIENITMDHEFRVVTCIHAPRNVASIINLLAISNMITSHMQVFAIHLVELIGRASTMLIVHESHGSSPSSSVGVNTFFNRTRAHSEKIITAFGNFQCHHNGRALVQTLTVVSPIDSMHEDICSLAEDKQATLIILAFHKQQGMDGNLEETNIELRGVNQAILSMAPCSVGLLVDRGLGLLCLSPSLGVDISHDRNQQGARLAMIYIGGPDDREALSYAWRMASKSIVFLTVVRFIEGDNVVNVDLHDFSGNDDAETITTVAQREKEIDNEFLEVFRKSTVYDNSITCIEKISHNGEETISMLREMGKYYDLYIVGRGQSRLSRLTVGLAEWSECPELGAIGDVLVTSDFATNSSVLVIQQYAGNQCSKPNARSPSSRHSIIQF